MTARLNKFLCHPADQRGTLAVAAFMALLVLGVVAGASGVTSTYLFAQASTLKWALTTLAPAFIIVMMLSKRPTMLVLSVAIVTLPLAPYVVSAGSFTVTITFALLTLATATAMIEGRVWEDIRGPRSALATIFPWALLALLLPSIAGGVVIHQIFYFAMVADIVWLCVRAARMYPDGRVVIAVMFVVMAGLQSLTAIYEFKTGHFLNLYGSAGNNTYATSKYFFVFKNSVRTTGTFFDPISLGNVLALALPLAMVIAISSQVKASWRALCVISIVAIMPALVISLSRASWIGAMVGLVAACVFARHGERERAFMASIALVVVTVIAALSYFGLTLIARFQTLLHPTSLSASTRNGDLARQAGWSASLHTFYQHPFAGVGFGRLLSTLENLPGANANAHASSVYLQYLAEGGLLGGLALLLFAVAIVVDLRRAGRNDVLFPALVGCSAVLAATWYTDFTVRYNAVAGCVAVIIGLIASGSQRVVRSSDHVVQPQLVVLDA